jgi:hypothetical protein
LWPQTFLPSTAFPDFTVADFTIACSRAKHLLVILPLEEGVIV